MPTDFEAVRIKCPFYVSEQPLFLTCEGVLDGSPSLKNFFVSKEEKRIHKAICCESEYKDCSLFKAINDKYEK